MPKSVGRENDWNIPESVTCGSDYDKEDRKYSVMQPFYCNKRWKSELAFVDFLEQSENIEWWFKNGERDATFFAVPYNNGEDKPFYVDFMVKLKDGRIGLFDPHGTYLGDFGPKSDGLRQYIESENNKGINLFGGIVTNTDQRNYTGRWIYFNKPGRELKKNDYRNWIDLEF